jgi:hypothetical protein
MVKRRNQTNRKKRSRKGFCEKRPKPRKINASTAYETCTEQLSQYFTGRSQHLYFRTVEGRRCQILIVDYRFNFLGMQGL